MSLRVILEELKTISLGILPPPGASQEGPGLSSLAQGGGKMRDRGNEVELHFVLTSQLKRTEGGVGKS